jgi:hypothetical protein
VAVQNSVNMAALFDVPMVMSDQLRQSTLAALTDPSSILINYIPGGHGTFLEYACNLAGGFCNSIDVFTSGGTAHGTMENDIYNDSRAFVRGHFYVNKPEYKQHKYLIEVVVRPEDRFPFEIGDLCRRHNMDYTELEVNTHAKLSQQFPEINATLAKNFLPGYGVDFFNCPKMVLMDYFRIYFHNSWDKTQHQEYISINNHGFKFSFMDFYNKEKFLQTLESIFDYVKLPIKNQNAVVDLYDEFLSKQRTYYKFVDCETILTNTENGIRSPDTIKLDCVQQGYIISQLEKKHNIEIPDVCEETFYTLPTILKKYNN